MRIVKSLAPWMPWLAFLLIAHGGMGRLAAGLVVALVAAVILAWMGLYRGVLMWAGLAFFALALVAVFGLRSEWFLTHLSVIANSMLAVGAWGSLLVGRPFTVAYAREHTDPARWNDPLFIRVNVLITAAWAAAFTLNAGAAWLQVRHPLPPWAAAAIQFGTLLAATVFTWWYPARVRARSPH